MRELTDSLLEYYGEQYLKESDQFREQNSFDMYVAFLERDKYEFMLENRVVYLPW